MMAEVICSKTPYRQQPFTLILAAAVDDHHFIRQSKC